MDKISIIVPFFNQIETTIRCAETVLSLKYENEIELILVNDGSTEPINYPHATIIRNDTNLGYIQSCNRAVQICTGNYLVFLNNDTIPQPNWLNCLMRTIPTAPRCGAVGCKLVWPHGLLQEAGCMVWNNGSTMGYGRGKHPDLPEFNYLRAVDYCSAAALLTPKQLFLDVGMFDERYVPAYYEDVDYCFTLRKHGYEVYYQPQAVVLHEEMKSTPPHEAAEQMLKNRKIFLEKWNLENKPEYSEINIAKARTTDTHKGNILFMEDAIPNPEEGQGFNRSFHIIQTMKELGYFVTIFPTKRPQIWHGSKYTRILQNQGIEVFYTTDEDIILNFRKLAETRPHFYDFVFISRPYNMNLYWNRIKNLMPGSVLLYDAEAIYCLRDFLKAEVEGRPVPEEEKRQILAKEVNLAKKASRTICVSHQEQKIFKQNGIRKPYVINYRSDYRVPNHKIRSGLLFIGGNIVAGSPNKDALNLLREKIMPLLPYNLTVVGKSDGTDSLGYIENLDDIYDSHKVFVAPHRVSGGVPCKIYDAMANGIPCVVSSQLASQLDTSGCYLEADSPENFSQQIRLLYEDEDLWLEIQDRARNFIIVNCNQEVFNHSVSEILKNKVILMV